ncbi:MAG: glycerophosphodiester phosphodiesterase [Asgard group archaeon]|nr:glycerophosphodiester phosphodiesterase [Asgard group archaeon]
MFRESVVPYLRGEQPLVMAHRGDSKAFPENSLPSFENALKLGADVIETDLRLTKDNRLVCFHDRRVNRLTNGKGRVKNYTLLDLKELELGYDFSIIIDNEVNYPWRGKGLEILSLQEILTMFPKIRFNLDIKDRLPEAIIQLTKLLHTLDAENRVMVSSFHHKQLQRFREVSGAPTSASPWEIFLFRGKIMKWLKQFEEEEIDTELQKNPTQDDVFDGPLPYFAVQVPKKFLFFQVIPSPNFIRLAHKTEIAVHVWTVDSPENMIKYLDWGIDGIFTNKPKLLIEILDNRK